MIINIKKIRDKFTRVKRDNVNVNISKKADRDWKVLLYIFIFITLLVVIIGVYILFFRIDRRIKIVHTGIKHINTINRSDLQKVLSDYANKENKFKKLLSKKIHFVDPSI